VNLDRETGFSNIFNVKHQTSLFLEQGEEQQSTGIRTFPAKKSVIHPKTKENPVAVELARRKCSNYNRPKARGRERTDGLLRNTGRTATQIEAQRKKKRRVLIK